MAKLVAGGMAVVVGTVVLINVPSLWEKSAASARF
jgi:hypothetical protein